MWFMTMHARVWGFLDGSVVNNPPAMQETQEMQIQSLGWDDPLEEEMAIYASTIAWRIPWTEEPGELQSVEFSNSQTEPK